MLLDPSKNIILSDEGFSGYPLKGKYLAEFETNMQRLKVLYGDPKIILGIRNQQAWLPSIYKQHLQEKGFRDISAVFNSTNTGLIKHDDLMLAPRIEILKNLFGEVFIYSQEALQNKPTEFIEKLESFLAIEKGNYNLSDKANKGNVGLKTIRQINLLKKLNKLNRGFEKIHPKLSLYGKLYKKLKLTPRDICQNRIKSKDSPVFNLSDGLVQFIEKTYAEDWEQAIAQADFS
jgi:hypothetical protein